jgi:uncharacterized protein (DUF1697 family)
MPVYISLLRGINVGGNKKIQMAELKTLYQSLGFGQAQTLLQSGNVVFTAESPDPDALAARIEAAVEARFGFQSLIILRTPAQLRAVFERHPFTADQLADPGKILVMFLQNAPDAQAVESLRQAHTGPEIIHPGGQELYIYYTDGMGRSKLDNGFIERRLKTTGTGRNWNTVSKLLALADAMQ